MTKDELKKLIYSHTTHSNDFDVIWNAVEAYSSASNSGKPLVSSSLPSREDAYKEGLSRKRRHEKNIVWKAKIFAAGAMWAKMKLTGISDVIGNDR